MDVLISICSPWKVGIDTFGIPFPGSWVDRVVVVHFNLDYSYPNMKNSDNPGFSLLNSVVKMYLMVRVYCQGVLKNGMTEQCYSVR